MTATERPRQGSAHLRPRARIISLMGEELISDEPVALVELVKNAYDADASRVEVRFEGPPGKPVRIVVQDDGTGMDLETILGAWFEPGTVSKRVASASPQGRVLQGAKGIGRFASARLGENLLLETKRGDEPDGVTVLLSWGQFDAESYLDEISVDYEVAPVDLDHGTRLTLEPLRSNWSRDDLRALHDRLSRLVSPFDEVGDFGIVLDVPGQPDLSGRVDVPTIVETPKYRLTGHVSSGGMFSGELYVDGHFQRPLEDRRLGESELSCGPFDVEIRAWDRDREGLQPFVELLGESMSEIRKTLNSYSGVSIYRDGFRVHPYGEAGNDWLQLDLRSRLNPSTRLANNQVIGAIRISREDNQALRDRSNREGLILNREFDTLAARFKEVLTLLEAERYRIRPRKEEAHSREALFEAFDLTPTVARARAELGSRHPITVLLTNDERELKAGVDRVQEAFSRMLLTAGLGQMVDVVLHEIGSPLGKINRQLVLLETELSGALDEDSKVPSMITSMRAWLEQIQSLRQRLEPQTAGRRARATTFNVIDEVTDTLSLYEALLDRQRIRRDLDEPAGGIVVTMPRAILAQITANLVDNAIFWITRHHGRGNGGTMRIRVTPLEHGFSLFVEDDGPGVLTEDQARIFEPYFSRKPSGIGLGLYIARFLIEPFGRLLLSDEGELSGAGFEARFEQGVGR